MTIHRLPFSPDLLPDDDDRDYVYDDNERITGYWVTTSRSPRYRSPHNPYSSHWGQGKSITVRSRIILIQWI